MHHRVIGVIERMFAVLAVVLGSGLAQAGPVVEADTVVYPGEPLAKTLRFNQLKSDAVIDERIELVAPSEQELQTLTTNQGMAKPVQVGFGRALPALYAQGLDLAQLNWDIVPGGQAAVLSVRSPGAAAIRLLVDVGDLPEGVELRFFKPGLDDNTLDDNTRVSAPITQAQAQQAAQSLSADDDNGLLLHAPLWSPVIAGDRIGLEIFIPASVTWDAVHIRLPLISHLVDAGYQPQLKSLAQLGRSGPCQVDVMCDNSDVPLELSDSVAKIRFTNQIGFTGLCSGILLNDMDESSMIPYFYTANHCVGDQFTASTLELFWFFQRVSCGGPDPTSVTQQNSGAQLLATGKEADYTLVQLNSSPPAGVGMSGWSTDDLHTQAGLIGIHHPSGDIKKISRGDGQGTVAVVDPGTGLGDPDKQNFIEMRWNKGVTEGGSSGSGLWAQSNGQLRLIGTLTGGFSFCAAPGEPDYYGRFDVAFPALEAFLAASNGPPPEAGARLKNISTNLHVDPSGAVAGFIVTGSTSQRFVLMGEDTAGSLLDPQLELVDYATGQVMTSNDDWRDHPTADEVVSRDREPHSERSAAFAVSLAEGVYLARLNSADGSSGRGVVSVTQVDDDPATHLLNISTNGYVDVEGAKAGFIVTDKGEQRFVIMGESEGSDGLDDPVLEVVSLDGTQRFGSNDDWRTHSTADEVVSKDRMPKSLRDAAMALTLPQGVYLAILKGKNGTSGRGLISVTEISD